MMLCKIIEPDMEPRTIPIEAESYIMGRGESNDIVFSDDTVSRVHARLINSEKGYFLEDLESRSGVYLNGKRIKKKVEVKGGDEIKIGMTHVALVLEDKTTTVYMDYQPIAEPGKENKKTAPVDKKRKMLIKVLVLLTAVVLVLVVVKLSLNNRSASREKIADRNKIEITPLLRPGEGPSPEEVAARKRADAIFNEGLEDAKAQRWEAATEKFKQAISLVPDHSGAGENLKIVKMEIIWQDTLQKGRTLIETGEYGRGMIELKKIPEKSAYFNDALVEIKRADEAVKTAAMGGVEKKGRALIEAAQQAYRNEQTDAAIRRLDEVDGLELDAGNDLKAVASDLKKKIAQAKALFNQGLGEHKAGEAEKARITWAKLFELDRKICGWAQSYYSNKAAENLANTFYYRCKTAYDQKAYIKALEYCQIVLSVSPSHRDAAIIDKKLEQQAKELYEEGYMIVGMNPEAAVLKWREVLQTSLPGSEYHEKAKVQIKKYAP